jgi:hypothetical protein
MFCRAASFIAVVCCVLLTSCSKPEDRTVPVEGQVRFEGKLLTTGTVIFSADAGKGNTTQHEPRGAIQPDGRYKVMTHPREGAPPGWYKVAVVSTEPSDPKNPYSMPRSLIPEKFGKVEESGLAIEVRASAPARAYDLELN